MPASNEFGVSVTPIDYTKPGTPTTKCFHGTSLEVAGRRVGRVKSWAPKTYSREAVQIWEINSDTWGRPVDIVPGRNSGYTISIARSEVWENEIELEFGLDSNVFRDLMDQTYPFDANEFLYKGSSVYRQWKYAGCWFTSRDESEVSSEGTGVIEVNGEIMFVSKTRLT